ncbi:Rcs stress response system protein RcsF [Thalassotalea fusca]
MKTSHTKQRAMRIIIAACSISLLSFCASHYEVSTNLDRENFVQYFAPAKVKIFKSEQDIQGKYVAVGRVEGEDCQEKAHHAIADEQIALTDARRKAFNLGANAIVFSGCATVTTKQCVSQKICYGRTFKISQ